MLIGFLYRGGLEQWSYAILADMAAQGIDVMRFTSQDVDSRRRLIHAEFWQRGQWQRRWTCYPAAIRNFEFRDAAQDEILTSLPYTLGRHLRKDDQLELLARLPETSKFVPKTLNLDSVSQVMDNLTQWPGVILKPARGRLGQGIAFIRALEDCYEFEQDKVRQRYTKAKLQQVLQDFIQNAGRRYVIQQFAATTGPQDRYFNIRIICHKGGDGDWHTCSFGLSLLAQPGSVVANREAGAVNVSMESMLARRFAHRSTAVKQSLFSAAVQIARALDDALAQQADELALDMAVDDQGRPWLHEVNWRGGFWALQEDVGLYRYGGANVLRLARRNRFGADAGLITAIRQLYGLRVNRTNEAGPEAKRLSFNRWAIAITRRSDDSENLLIRAWQTGVREVLVSTLASFGSTLSAVGKTLTLLEEQMGEEHGVKIMVGIGYSVHDPHDSRSPRRWLADEMVNPGLMSTRDAEAGFCWSAAFLRHQTEKAKTLLSVPRLYVIWLEGWELLNIVSSDAFIRWLQAAETLAALRREGHCERWGWVLEERDLTVNWSLVLDWLKTAQSQGMGPDLIGLKLTTSDGLDRSDFLEERLQQLAQLSGVEVFAMPKPLPPSSKAWDAPHRQLPAELARSLSKSKMFARIVLPIGQSCDWDDFLSMTNMTTLIENSQKTSGLTAEQLQAVQTFASFDPRQLFRFFVDGRFHKKYKGWTGYEGNESGSVKGILDAYTLMLARFDAVSPLTAGYIRDLHIACMSGVTTKNSKSTPGELRFLESGINLYHGNSTIASLQELLDDRRGDGNFIFHHPDYQRTAEEFTAQEIKDILAREGRVRYRAWYPNLTQEQRMILMRPISLGDFYTVKHYVQRCFAERTDAIIEAYNHEQAQAITEHEKLIAISRVVRDLELLHPFPDGNGRTFVAVLMNHLLLSQGFLPAILRDPNIDAELSVKEFSEEIVRGIDNTKTLLATPNAVLFDYSVERMSPVDNRTFAEMSQHFNRALSELAWGTDSPDTDQLHTLRVTLTPARLAQICGGRWLNVSASWMRDCRFVSVAIEADMSVQGILFCRQVGAWRERGLNPIHELTKATQTGTLAFVLDAPELAQSLEHPVLLVPDVDDALYQAARAVRQLHPCKAVAVLGTELTSVARGLLLEAIGSQATVQADAQAAKTPQVMAALANLKQNDELAVMEVVTGARPSVARHRMGAISPSIILFCSTENASRESAEVHQEVVKTLATCTEAIVEGGLCLVNADSPASDVLCKAIRELSNCAIQTFGTQADNQARLISASFNVVSQAWSVQAEILGEQFAYQIHGDTQAPLMSVGALLVLANLGLSIKKVCSDQWH